MCHILKLFSFQERSVPILGGVIDSSLFISTLDNTCEETNNIIIEEINVVEVFNWHQLRGKMTSQFKFTKTYYAARCFFFQIPQQNRRTLQPTTSRKCFAKNCNNPNKKTIHTFPAIIINREINQDNLER